MSSSLFFFSSSLSLQVLTRLGKYDKASNDTCSHQGKITVALEATSCDIASSWVTTCKVISCLQYKVECVCEGSNNAPGLVSNTAETV